MCDLLNTIGVYNVVNSTGFVADDINDNAIISHQMQDKTGVFVTSCVRAFNEKHIRIFEELDVHALRLMSPKVAEHLL